MAIFLITMKQAPVNRMKHAIEKYYVNEYLQVGELAWLVSDTESITPQSVSVRLGGGDASVINSYGSHIISTFNGYWGYHDGSTWDWLQAKGL